jgi:predicted Zn-dependent peptidase
MILGATWDNQMFLDNYFKEEKSNQITEIKDLINDKFRYAFEQFVQWMFHKELFGITVLGDEKSIKKITNQELSGFYQNTFLRQNRMIFFLDHKINPVYLDLVSKFSTFEANCTPYIPSPILLSDSSSQVRRKTETDQNQQSWIFMGFRFARKLPEDMYPAMLLFNNIFGGQSNSILYRKVREEKGLCYFINSSLPAGVDAIIITAGIARKNQKTFEDVIQQEILKLETSPLEESQLQTAKEMTCTALNSILDHPYQLISLKIESILFNKILSLSDLIKRINLVTIDRKSTRLNSSHRV